MKDSAHEQNKEEPWELAAEKKSLIDNMVFYKSNNIEICLLFSYIRKCCFIFKVNFQYWNELDLKK